MKEIWKDIEGYEGLYQVSNLGRVKSLARVITRSDGRKQPVIERMLKVFINNKGYPFVTVHKNGKSKSYRIHQLVAVAFLGHKPDGTTKIVVDHINGDKLNNRLDNLQLVSHRYNTSKDKKGVGKHTGVVWHKRSKKWESQISINYKKIFLGSFINEEEAGDIYQLALKNIDKYDGNPKEFREYLKSL